MKILVAGPRPNTLLPLGNANQSGQVRVTEVPGAFDAAAVAQHEREWGGGVGALRSDLHSDEALRLVTVAAHVVVQRTLGDATLAAELDTRDGALLVAFQ